MHNFTVFFFSRDQREDFKNRFFFVLYCRFRIILTPATFNGCHYWSWYEKQSKRAMGSITNLDRVLYGPKKTIFYKKFLFLCRFWVFERKRTRTGLYAAQLNTGSFASCWKLGIILLLATEDFRIAHSKHLFLNFSPNFEFQLYVWEYFVVFSYKLFRFSTIIKTSARKQQHFVFVVWSCHFKTRINKLQFCT